MLTLPISEGEASEAVGTLPQSSAVSDIGYLGAECTFAFFFWPVNW
jgi:hypothetical protein